MNYKEIAAFIEKHWNIVGNNEQYSVIFKVLKKNGKISRANCGYNHTVTLNPTIFFHRFLINTDNCHKISEICLKGSLLHEIGHSKCRDIVQLGTTVRREVMAQKWAIEYAFVNHFEEEMEGLLWLLKLWGTIPKGAVHRLAHDEIYACRKWARKYELIV